MTRSTKHRRGRPKSTGSGKPIMVRIHAAQIKALDRWIGASAITRPEAIRQLVTWALDQTGHDVEQVADNTTTQLADPS